MVNKKSKEENPSVLVLIIYPSRDMRPNIRMENGNTYKAKWEMWIVNAKLKLLNRKCKRRNTLRIFLILVPKLCFFYERHVEESGRGQRGGWESPWVPKNPDAVEMFWLTSLWNVHSRFGVVPLDWKTGFIIPSSRRGTEASIPTIGGLHYSEGWEAAMGSHPSR